VAPETFNGNFPLYVLMMVVESTVLKVLCCTLKVESCEQHKRLKRLRQLKCLTGGSNLAWLAGKP
jgi:hypothetical protein